MAAAAAHRASTWPSGCRRMQPRALRGGAVAPPPPARASPSFAPPPPLGKPKLRFVGAAGAAAGLQDGMSALKPALLAAAAAEGGQPPPPPISKGDDAFMADLGVEFVWGHDGVVIEELNNLFEKVGFPRRDPARLALALQNTYRTVWVRAARKSRLAKQGQMLGFARATSDGALSAVIWDVSVAPAWQRSGLGRALIERLTASLVTDGICTITLYAEPNVVALYEKLGYVADPEGVRGVAYQRTKAARSLAGGLLGRR